MYLGRTEDSQEPEDPDAKAAQVVRQLEDPASYKLLTAGDTGPEIRHFQGPEAFPESLAITKPSSFEIVPPAVSNPNDYEYLPGHFVARRILEIDSSTAEKPLYTVRLQSGERETVSFIICFRLLVVFL
jgi:chromodomain-helicase-DNA-binding protein 4